MRYHRWRTQRPFDRAGLLARRLELENLDEASFRSLLEEVPSEEHASGAPDWVDAVRCAHELADAAARLGNDWSAVHDPSGLAPARAFVEPFVAAAMRRLFASARVIRAAYPDAPFDPEHATRLFEPALWQRLLTRAMKVIVLEVNVARVRGLLVGATPEARCASFVDQLRTTGLRRQIIEEYPVLARSLVTAAEFWQRAAAEFLEHLASDADDVAATFANPLGAPLGALSALHVGAGDVHRHGRSVIIAEFSAGLRVVYKPRALSIDRHFEELVAWVNARGQEPTLEAVHTITRGDHGWAELAPATPCGTTEELARFYQRFGAQLALLHVLEATDFHYENVIASGEHPMLIDLEALFHPQPELPIHSDEPEWVGWSALQRSVLRAGVLPFRADAGEQSEGIDMSAVGGGKGQKSPGRHQVLAAAGTDEVHLIRDHVQLPDSNNRPTLGAEGVNPAAYADRILAGFTSTYRLLMRHRGELLAANGPIRRFAEDQIRVVLRPTRQYALLLGESYHPDVLRDALERDRLIDRLWVAVPARPELERVIGWEHADLLDGDVPLFTSQPGSRDLFTSSGRRIDGFFARTGLDAAIEKIESLSEAELQRQQWVVRASLMALLPGRHDSLPSSGAPTLIAAATTGEMPSSDRCLDAARVVARRLADIALQSRGRVSWLGVTLLRERDWVIQPVGGDLYGGTLGIALFLAQLARITGDSEPEQLAREVVGQVVRRTHLTVSAGDPGMIIPGSLGAFGVLGGAVYALSHLAVLWDDEALGGEAAAIAEHLAGSITSDRHLDVIGGVAGLMLAAASLDVVHTGSIARGVLSAGADRLVETAQRMRCGGGWITALEAKQPLTGLSHGASGMALALLAAWRLVGHNAALEAVAGALRYERSAYDPERRNWPDYRVLPGREDTTDAAMMWSWCHGAPGIGLVRLEAQVIRPELSDREPASVSDDLAIALESTARFGLGANDSLCHGDLGNLELFIRARELGYDGTWQRSLAAASAAVVNRVARGEWRCGIPGGVETPGLMMGLAGIGYGLLRLGVPDRVASVLSLEAPRVAPRWKVRP